MIGRIIEFSARNRFMIALLIASICVSGYWAYRNTPLDAIPDLSDVQVIVYTKWADRSPDIVEDQVTYPLVTQLLSAPNVKSVRATSFFGFSLVYVIFDDGTDPYWARSRVLEYLSGMAGQLPDGVAPQLGPDATGVGWGLEYVLVDKSGKHNLAELRSLQDWNIQYQLRSVPGVAEVASVGGYVKQYQITIDPDKLMAYNLPINQVTRQIRRSNQEVGGRVLEFTGREYMVRGHGYFESIEDIEEVAVAAHSDGTPIRIRDIAVVQEGPEIRRGVTDYNGMGDTAGGVVVVRYGANTYEVLQNVKQKIEQSVVPSLPDGVEIQITYDRSQLIEHSVETLREKLIEEGLIVSLVCIVFLFHFRSALVAIIILPLAVMMALVAMRSIGLTSNIMSLGGIAIAVGAMIDAAIIMIENAHKHIEHEELKPEAQQRDRTTVIIEAAKEVGPSLFFSLLVITVSFLPVFALQDQEGRLFKPLAYTKTFSMMFAALLSITVGPFLMTLLIRGRVPSENKNPINRFLIWVYHPFAHLALRLRYLMVLLAIAAVVAIIPIYQKLGSEFMPPLWEETVMYMPVAPPGGSIETMRQAIVKQDRVLMTIPEVASVFAKAGRAETATDPAPLVMVETIINLKPPEEWRAGLTHDELIAEMDARLRDAQIGFTNSWTMPIKGRIDMLSTGIRTPIGIKIFGDELETISQIGHDIEAALSGDAIAGTRSVFAERVTEGYYLDFDPDRHALARYSLTIADLHEVIQSAVGGMNVATTVEGRERYPVNVRYGRDFRNDLDKLRRVLIETPHGAQIPLDELADVEIRSGPGMVKSEGGTLVGYVYIDITDRDPGSYVADAKKIVEEQVKLPDGYYLQWSGAFESMQRAKTRLMYVIPFTLLVIVVLLYFNTKSFAKLLIVLLAVPFSLVGAFLLLHLLGYHLSVAVWVGIIALAGVDAETGVVMLLYLDHAFEKRKQEGRLRTFDDLEEAILEGAVQRVRPKMMTVMAILMGLLPIMWSTGAGADVMKRIAAPMVGGVVTSFLLELLIYPAVYAIWKSWTELRHLSEGSDA